MKKLVSIVIPLFNEEANVDELYRKLLVLMEKEKEYKFEVIAVEHGSTDSTFKKLVSIHKKDKRIKILQLSKNFGNVDAAVSAGLNFASGNASVILMGDLQEPPELISEFINKWKNGYEIVYGVVKRRADFSKIRELNSKIFYKILKMMTGDMFSENASDFRLIDEKVKNVINSMPERNKFLRGLITWTGFRQIGIPYSRKPRFAGASKADFLTVLKVAANGIFSFSYVPLRIVTIVGFLVSLISFSTILIELMLIIIFGRVAPGIFTVIFLIGFLFGILFIILGIIGEYLARIYDEVKQRPNYIVKDKIGFNG
jgi:glycosyltransferase involved in cell wall biosynthesis